MILFMSSFALSLSKPAGILGFRSQSRCEASAVGFWGRITISLRAKRSTRRASRRRGEFVLRPRKRPIPNLFFDRTSMHFAKSWCRSVAAAGDLLFFASPKKSKQKKGDPTVCVPSLRCGHLPVLSPAGVPLELAALRQSRALFRLGFRSSAHTEGFCGDGIGRGVMWF